MQRINVQEVVRSYDCSTANCPGEARGPGEQCSRCQAGGAHAPIPRPTRELATQLVERFRTEPRTIEPLTRAERLVLDGALEGESCAETAARLSKAVGTVQVQRKRVIAKLGARNITHAVSIAFRHGVVV